MIYLLIGVVWVWFLEYITTNHIQGDVSVEWTMIERITTFVFWPFSLVIFMYNFIKTLIDGTKK